GKNSLNRLIRCVCGKKIGPDPRNFNQRVSLGRNDLLIRTFPKRSALFSSGFSCGSGCWYYFKSGGDLMATAKALALMKEIEQRNNKAAAERIRSLHREVDQDAIEAGLIEWNNEKIKENLSIISELIAATKYEQRWKEAIRNKVTPERQQKINLQKEKKELKEQEKIARELAKEKARQEREERKLNPPPKPPKPPKPVKPPKKYHPPIDPKTGKYKPRWVARGNRTWWQVRRIVNGKIQYKRIYRTREEAEIISIGWQRELFGNEEEFLTMENEKS
ncbi:hypothetical protein LDZ38_01150, partial [Klebsiella quasipneumoniae]|nr:hypothetical protein [Klebsiella quasipneumoniae]